MEDLFVIGQVRGCAAKVRPLDRRASRQAVAVALAALAGGASTSEACSAGRRCLDVGLRQGPGAGWDRDLELVS